MSLKDDFLEALRSVKRDFFKDYEQSEESMETPETEKEQGVSATGFSETPLHGQAVADHSDPISSSGAQADEESSDKDASRASGPDRASIMDNFQPELHMPMAQEEYVMREETAAGADVPIFDIPGHEKEGVAEEVSVVEARTGGSGGEVPIYNGRFSMDDFDAEEEIGDERTIISKNTVIRGALQTDDSVRMFGQILGDIDCRSNILVAGKVRGNTSAANAYIINAQVDGNVLCDDVVNVTDDAWILGNIRAQQADIDGKIKGNIEIRHTISIGSNSSIIGNISTDELEIRRGAFVNGQIMMYSPSRDVIDRFDRFDQQ